MASTLEDLKFNYEPYNPEFFIRPLLEGVVVLVVVLALVAFAVAVQRPRPASRIPSFCWISGVVVVSTVMLDWAFLLLLYIVPWPG